MPPVLPRRRLNLGLLNAVRASAIPHWRLSRDSGFSQPTQFSTFLHAQVVPVSPLTANRLKVLAHLVGYDGPIFVEDEATAPEATAR